MHLDPILTHTMRLYLAILDVDHAPAAEGSPVCHCGDVQANGRDRHLLEVITEQFAEPELAPHVVHVKNAIVALPVEDGVDVDGKKVKIKGTRYTGPDACPDCTRGLTSRGDDMICPQLSMDTELKGCHAGCVVACGREG